MFGVRPAWRGVAAVLPVLAAPAAAPAECPLSCAKQPQTVATQQVSVPTPKVVVTVPAPEVVFERAAAGGPAGHKLCGLFGHHRFAHDPGAAAGPTVATIVTPLPTVTTMSATSWGSIGTFGVTAVPTMVTPTMAVNGTNAAGCGEFAGLRGLQEAELRAAAISAARAHQEAELQATMAALDRTKASVAALATTSGGAGSGATTAATTQTVAEATKTLTTAVALTGAMGQKLEALEKTCGSRRGRFWRGDIGLLRSWAVVEWGRCIARMT